MKVTCNGIDYAWKEGDEWFITSKLDDRHRTIDMENLITCL